MRLPLLAYYLPSRGILVTLACAVGTTGLQFFGSYSLFSRSELPLPLMTTVMAFGTAFAWMMGIRFVAGNSKLSEFEAVLPVATRDLSLIRTLAMAVFWLMPVWAGFATIMTISASKGMAEQVVAHGVALTLSVSGCVLLATVIRYRALRAEPSRFQSSLRQSQ